MRDMLDDDEVEHAPPPHRWRYWAGAGVAVVGLGLFFMLPHDQTKHAHFDFITTINLPPPPPPPKPPPEPPKTQEPQQQQKTVQNNVPKTSASHAAPHQALTAMAGAGTNAYGLQAGNGSGDDTIGGDGDGAQDWSSYSPVISAALQSAIAGDQDLRSGEWAGQVRFWFNANGIITKAEMAESTGDAKRDREIETRMIGRLIEADLPATMPQPVTVAITSSST